MPSSPPPLLAFRRSSAGLFATLVVALGLAACTAAAPSSSPGGSSAPPASSGAPSGSPGAGATASPSAGVGAIDHPTGATDIVLRMERGGGFVPLDFLAVEAPIFTLYGNGIIVFQQRVENFPQPDASGVIHNTPWRTAKLDEDQIQELLGFAITQGGLGTARDVYMANIADAPSTTFTVHAGGLDKTVNVHALSEATADTPDAAARTAFLRVAERLEDFDRGGTISSDVYEPAAYRGILSAREGDVAQLKAWPWPAIKPTDFKEGPNDGSGGVMLPHRTMTSAEVGALGIE
jgi:hypothetical protein